MTVSNSLIGERRASLRCEGRRACEERDRNIAADSEQSYQSNREEPFFPVRKHFQFTVL